jgi:hypothetical protein
LPLAAASRVQSARRESRRSTSSTLTELAGGVRVPIAEITLKAAL